MAKRNWTNDSGLKLNATNLNGMETDIAKALDLGYVVTAFTGNGVANEKLSVFYSPDGKTLFGGGANNIYADTATGTSLRDPSTIKIGDKWFTAHTVNNGYTKNFAIIQSTDLINWTNIAYIDVSSIATLNQAWAPELIVDTNGDVYAFFSSMTTGNVGSAYYVKALNAGLTSWSAPTAMVWTSAPTNLIDPNFILHNGVWYCFYKHEGTKYIERATSTTLTGTYTTDKTGDWAAWGSGVEGPQLVKVNDTTWRLYVDRYQAATGYAYTESTDLTTWTTLTGIKVAPGVLGVGQTVRHGSFVKLDGAQSAGNVMAAVLPKRGTDISYYTSTGSKANVDGANQAIATPVYQNTGSTVNVGTAGTGTVTITTAGIYSIAFSITLYQASDLAVTKPATGRTFLDIAPNTGPVHTRASINTGEDAATANHAGIWLSAGEVVNFKLYQTTGGTAWYLAKVWLTKHPA